MRVLQYGYLGFPKLPRISQKARVTDSLLLLLLWTTVVSNLSAFGTGRTGCTTCETRGPHGFRVQSTVYRQLWFSARKVSDSLGPIRGLTLCVRVWMSCAVSRIHFA